MFVQYSQHAPSLAVESETPQLAIEDAVAPPKNLAEPEKDMLVYLEGSSAVFISKPAARCRFS